MPGTVSAISPAYLGIEKLRFFFRLAVGMHYFDKRRYEHAVQLG